ncbi:MAG: hypothetical protein A2X86_03045 [Bdellovibrionales bacterium GWA2_49_15]|nr:MAG: hypothetical protein A2X86_03045 [Bdellovibrionales bacterium GWA2_49_15]
MLTAIRNISNRAIGAVLLLLVGSAFVFLISYTTETRQHMAQDSDVLLTTHEVLKAKILFDELKDCESFECFKKAQLIELPKYDFRTHPDYQTGLSRAEVNYLLEIAVPERLLALNVPLSLFPGYINLKRYGVYHDGHQILAGDGTSSAGAMAIISLPKSAHIQLLIKGELASNDTGIMYKGAGYLGPSTKLSDLLIHKERSMVTFYLIWLLTMGTLLALFSALYIFTSKRDAYGEIVGFATTAMLSLLMKSDFLGAVLNLNWRLFILLICETSGAFFIFKFFMKLAQKKQKYYLYVCWALALFMWASLAFAFSQGVAWIGIAGLFRGLEVQFVVLLGFGLVYSVIYARKQKRWGIVAILGALIGLKAYFLLRNNIFYSPLADLSILLYVAAAAVLEFADNEKTLKRQEERLKSQARDVAIGKTAAMMAHDVRKPFTQMKIILDSFEDFSKNLSGLHAARKDVARSLGQVQAMVNEIMDFGRVAPLKLKPYSLYNLLDFVVGQIGYSFPKNNIRLQYFLDSKSMPLMDHERMSRAITNIVTNAVEVILENKIESGIITFRSRDVGRTIVLDITNDGPNIPPGIMERIFEPFYTSGKNTGTGLGLASAKQTLELHGGSIEAVNVAGGVSFSLHLNASSEMEFNRDGFLPATLCGRVDDLEKTQELEHTLLTLNQFEGKIRILILEDQELYRDWVKRQIDSCLELKNKVTIYESFDVDQALALTKEKNITHALVDLDLGQRKNGEEYLKALAGDPNAPAILVHSNRRPDFLPEGREFAPKPIVSEDLVIFIASHLKEIPKTVVQLKKTPVIYVCDDSAILGRHLKKEIQKITQDSQAKVEVFSCGEDLIQASLTMPPDVVFSDYYMDRCGQLTGLDVVKEFKTRWPDIPVYMVSNLEDPSLVKQILKEGALDTLPSPPQRSKLQAIIEQSLQ